MHVHPTPQYLERTDILSRLAREYAQGLEIKLEKDSQKEEPPLPDIFAFYKDGIKVGEIDFSEERFIITTHARHFEPYALKIAAALDAQKRRYTFYNTHA